MRVTSFLTMTAALSILVGTSAAFAGSKKPNVDVHKTKLELDVDNRGKHDKDKYDLDIDQKKNATLKINENTINQDAAINKKKGSKSFIDITKAVKLGNITNIGDTVQNTANTGDISVAGRINTGAHTGHGDSNSVSAVGAASSVSVSVSSISSSVASYKKGRR